LVNYPQVRKFDLDFNFYLARTLHRIFFVGFVIDVALRISFLGFTPVMARISTMGSSVHVARIYFLGSIYPMAFLIASPQWVSTFIWLALVAWVSELVRLYVNYLIVLE